MTLPRWSNLIGPRGVSVSDTDLSAFMNASLSSIVWRRPRGAAANAAARQANASDARGLNNWALF